MIDHLLKFFVTFLVVVEPIGVIPIFIAVTEGVAEKERRRMARKGVMIAGGIFLLFAFVGSQFLRVLGISLDAFRIFGGLLLLLIALEMVFARESGSRSSNPEVEEGKARADISVFPLATPLIAGPGAISAVILLATAEGAFSIGWVLVVAAMLLILVLCYMAMLVAIPIQRLLGITGLAVVSRVVGVLLAALAIQFLIDGIRTANIFG